MGDLFARGSIPAAGARRAHPIDRSSLHAHHSRLVKFFLAAGNFSRLGPFTTVSARSNREYAMVPLGGHMRTMPVSDAILMRPHLVGSDNVGLSNLRSAEKNHCHQYYNNFAHINFSPN